MALDLYFQIEGGDFTRAGNASSQIKKILKKLNIDPKSIKRIVVALYEAEVNVVAHACQGEMHVIIDESNIKVTVKDKGPGISDISQAMTAGFSTASKEVRDMGFGAGMGLPNIRKNTDELEITSVVGEGTVLTFRNYY